MSYQLQALLSTLVLEGALALWLTHRWAPDLRPSTGQVLMVATAASLLTHPVLWVVVQAGNDHLPIAAHIAVCESIVVVVETLIYRRGLGCSLRRAFQLSLACNALSLFLPMAVRAVL